jgi:hypothetical protein
VDVIDQGMKPNPYRDGALQHKVDVAWQIEELRDDGKRFVVYKRYTASLNEKATLRHDLESWRGRPFTAGELAGFDLESVIGANCILNVVHNPSKKDSGKVFANVAAVMPLMKGLPKIAADGYVRKVAGTEDDETPPPSDNDYVPEPIEEPPF